MHSTILAFILVDSAPASKLQVFTAHSFKVKVSLVSFLKKKEHGSTNMVHAEWTSSARNNFVSFVFFSQPYAIFELYRLLSVAPQHVLLSIFKSLADLLTNEKFMVDSRC